MTEHSYLDPGAMKQQCLVAMNNLRADNDALKTAELSLTMFANDTELKGSSFDTLKSQISDYKSVLQEIRASNDSDIADFRTLIQAVGNEVLDGSYILAQQSKAMAEAHFYEDKSQKWLEDANNNPFWGLDWYYYGKAAYYSKLAANSIELYKEMKAKEAAYDNIENATRSLFSASAYIRNTARSALMSMTGAFVNGSYQPDMTAGWRKEITENQVNRVMYVSEDGETVVNWQEVEKILKKDANEITEAEYYALTQAYVHMENEDLAQFVKLLMNKEGDIYWSPVYGAYGNGIFISTTEWKVDEVKTNKLLRCMKEEIKNTLEGVKDGTIDAPTQVRVLQRNTILEVVKDVETFRGEYEGEAPDLSFVSGDDNLVTMLFYEERTSGKAEYYTSYGQSSVVFHDTSVGLDLELEGIEVANASYRGFFCGENVIAESMADYAADEVASYVIDNLPEAISKGAGKALGVVGLGVDIVQGMEEQAETVAFLDEWDKITKKMEIFEQYQCMVNIVEYDIADGKQTVLYGYEGKRTEAVVNQTNVVFEEYGGHTFTVKEIVENPLKVCDEYYESINGDDIAEDRFNEATNW